MVILVIIGGCGHTCNNGGCSHTYETFVGMVTLANGMVGVVAHDWVLLCVAEVTAVGVANM